MYAQHLAFTAPIHFIGVKKDAELRGSDSVMQAAMCSCEIQLQWKGGTWFEVRSYRCGSNPHVSCQKLHDIGHACPILTLTISIIIPARANEIFPAIMCRKLCNEGILELFKRGRFCPQSVSIEGSLDCMLHNRVPAMQLLRIRPHKAASVGQRLL